MDFVALAAECAPWVAPETMAAIVKTESQFKPFAININGGAKLERQPSSKVEAIVTARWLLNNNYNIDMGLGQINSANLKKTNLTVEDAFDQCKNLAASATILQWNYESASKSISGEQAALQAAISAYNTGSFTKGFGNGYVSKVVRNAKGAINLEVTTQSVVKPIPLENASKNKWSAEGKDEEIRQTAVQLKATKSSVLQTVDGNDVYRNDAVRSSVMVY